MCLIIDADVCHELAASPPAKDARPVLAWLRKRSGQLAIGGQLTAELSRTQFRRLLIEFVRAGIAKNYPTEPLEREASALPGTKLCKSRDFHVIALARVAGCRLVYTRDKPLQRDIKNSKLLSKPRGKVYSSHQHSGLLKTCPACL